MSAEEINKNIGYTASNNPYRATRDGREFEGLLPAPTWHEEILKRNGTVDNTVNEMRKIVAKYAWQTKELAKRLKADSKYETCKNIWHFLYEHIKYKEDDKGEEQLRTPALSWHVRKSRGIDCDDFSIFAGCILYDLGIPFYFRIAGYPDPLRQSSLFSAPEYSHVYVVVPHSDKRYICIDAVIDAFDAEKTPIKNYKDFKVMDKENLRGIDITLLSGADDATEAAVTQLVLGAHFPGRGELDGTPSREEELDALYKHLLATRELVSTNPSLIKNNEDPQSFLKMLDYAIQYWNTDKRDEALAILEQKEKEINDLEGVGELPEGYEEMNIFYGIEGLQGVSVLGKSKKVRAFFAKVKETVKKAGEGVKNAFKAVVRYSPITVSSRAGMLLALKLNIGKIASRLKWGFLTEEEAKKHGFDMVEWRKLRDKLALSEKLFVEVMQGSAQNFKDAILQGRAGGLSGITEEEESLGVDPITTSATLIATALPFIKKILDLLKDVDFKKMTAKVDRATLERSQKEAEAATPIPEDVKTALPDNNITPETKIDVKPEGTQNNLPIETPKTDAAKTETPSTSDTTSSENISVFTEIGNWVKDNPGKTALIAGGLVLAFSSTARHAVGLGIVTGKGKSKKGKKKNNPPKAISGVGKRHSSKHKKGKGGGGHKTIHL